MWGLACGHRNRALSQKRHHGVFMHPNSLRPATDPAFPTVGLSLRGGARQRGEEAPQVGSNLAREVEQSGPSHTGKFE